MEHAFHEAKSQLGLAQYQVRVWRGWHHHMSLCCLAMLFLLREQERTTTDIPLLSFRDLTELLDHYLPRRSATEEEVLRQMQKRHNKRQLDIDRRRKVRKKPVLNLTK